MGPNHTLKLTAAALSVSARVQVIEGGRRSLASSLVSRILISRRTPVIRLPRLILALSATLLVSAGLTLAQTYTVPAGQAVIVVKVHQEAAVTIGGQATTQKGSKRIFRK